MDGVIGVRDLLISYMRTVVVPPLAALLLGAAARAGLDLDSAKATGIATLAAGAGYVVVLRAVEEWAGRRRVGWLQKTAGVLLGWARPPRYGRPDDRLAADLAPYQVRDL